MLAKLANASYRFISIACVKLSALVQVYDALGSLVLTVRADATGTAALGLPMGLSSGLYLVRSGARQALRLKVE